MLVLDIKDISLILKFKIYDNVIRFLRVKF